jgi:hypothetical protein
MSIAAPLLHRRGLAAPGAWAGTNRSPDGLACKRKKGFPAAQGRRRGAFAPGLRGYRRKGSYPRTLTPEKESTARPRTGWPKNRAGSNLLNSSTFSSCDRVAASVGPETMR